MDDDDDAPPPLSSLSEQVEALRLRASGVDLASTSGQQAESLRIASAVFTTDKSTGKPPAATAPPALKRGFFDAKPSTAKPKPKPKPQEEAVEEIPMIRAKQAGGPATGPAIPDFLRVQPDDDEKKYAAMKKELLDKLKPTPDVVNQIAGNADLLHSFDDPEVMAAVNDVAKNPANWAKYKNNPKVLKFYQAMGQMMGDKLEKEGKGGAAGQAPPGTGWGGPGPSGRQQ